MQKRNVFLFALAALCLSCEAKYFSTNCELVRELRRQGFPEGKMSNWVCLIEKESGRDTRKVHTNKNGSKDYGLFQINDGYWCSKTSKPGKDCNVTCADLLTDDITKASACAKKIYNRHGFNAWHAWKNYCQGSLPDIRNC